MKRIITTRFNINPLFNEFIENENRNLEAICDPKLWWRNPFCGMLPKYITSYVDCPKFLPYLERTCFENMPKRRLAATYLAAWLSEVIFPIAGKEVRNGCIYPTSKMAFGTKFALAPALVSYLCTRLKMLGFLVHYTKSYNGYFGEHILYAWFVYHCHGLHRLGKREGLPFYRAVTNGSDTGPFPCFSSEGCKQP